MIKGGGQGGLKHKNYWHQVSVLWTTAEAKGEGWV